MFVVELNKILNNGTNKYAFVKVNKNSEENKQCKVILGDGTEEVFNKIPLENFSISYGEQGVFKVQFGHIKDKTFLMKYLNDGLKIIALLLGSKFIFLTDGEFFYNQKYPFIIFSYGAYAMVIMCEAGLNDVQ